MSDDADLAQDRSEREEALRKKYNRKPVLEAEVTGECLNCYAPVGFGRRWCDADCRGDWEKRRGN
jgi:hypothetical protein